jgi:hypothetical protein
MRPALSSSPLRIVWLEQGHPNLVYYDALQTELQLRGHNVSEARRSGSSSRFSLRHALAGRDVLLIGFGWFHMERPPLPRLPEFDRAPGGACASNRTRGAHAASSAADRLICLCGSVPLAVVINKEYTLMREKLAWVRSHCVDLALTVHHDAKVFEAETGVPFHRIWFGVDATRFAGLNHSKEVLELADQQQEEQGAAAPDAVVDDDDEVPHRRNGPGSSGGGSQRERIAIGSGRTRRGGLVLTDAQLSPPPTATAYSYDMGFTGVIRADQTENWRSRIWKQAWPVLAARGVRLFSGPPKGVRAGVTHAELSQDEYVRSMRASKLWLSTTGPADLVGTRFFEVMSTGTTLCVCNRMPQEKAAVYESLGIRDGKHVLMFSTLSEFNELVINYTQIQEYEPRRMAIVRRAQALATRRFTWAHVAERLDNAIHAAIRNQTRRTSMHASVQLLPVQRERVR